MTEECHRNGEAGFSLVELLVVCVLLGLIAMLASGGMRFGAATWERAYQNSRTTEAVATARSRIRQVLALAGSALPAAEREGGGFAGSAAAAAFRGPASSDSPERGETDYRLVAGGERLVLEARAAWTTAPWTERAAIDGVAEAGLSYRADGMPPGSWRESWAADWPLPDLVRLQLRPVDPRDRWPDLVVRLTTRRSPACRQQPVALGCLS